MSEVDNQEELLDQEEQDQQEEANTSPAPEQPAKATRKVRVRRKKTWQEKLDDGDALTELEDVKSEADYNVRRHLREQKERALFEARKNRSLRRGQLSNREDE